MRDCAYTQIGVWSANSLDRTVVVAVYGNPPGRLDSQATDVVTEMRWGRPVGPNHWGECGLQAGYG